MYMSPNEHSSPFFVKDQVNISEYLQLRVFEKGNIVKTVRDPISSFCGRAESLLWDSTTKTFAYERHNNDGGWLICNDNFKTRFSAKWTDNGEVGIISECMEMTVNDLKVHEIGLLVVVDKTLYRNEYKGNGSFLEWKQLAMGLLNVDTLMISKDLNEIPYSLQNLEDNLVMYQEDNLSNATKNILISYCKKHTCNVDLEPYPKTFIILGLVATVAIVYIYYQKR